MQLRSFAIVVGLLFFCASSFAQSPAPANPQPTPSPKPAVKRRTFDQFDLNNGVTVGSGRSPIDSNTSVNLVVEFVDQRTYDGFTRLVSHVADVERNYRSTAGMMFDPVDRQQPERVLNTKLNAIFRLNEMFREGLLDQVPFQDPSNRAYLDDNVTILVEAMAVAAVRGDWSNDQRKLNQLADKYNAVRSVPGEAVSKRSILTAMLAKLSENLNRIKNQIDVKR